MIFFVGMSVKYFYFGLFWIFVVRYLNADECTDVTCGESFVGKALLEVNP